MQINKSVNIAVQAITEGAKTGANITIGNIINQRVAMAVKPMLPIMVRGYVDTPLGQSVVGALAATVVLQFLSNNEQARLAAGAMYEAAGVGLVTNFNFEAKFNEILGGLDMSALTPAAQA